MKNPYFQNLYDDLKACEHARRGTGRTTALIESMNDGDVLVVHHLQFADDCRRIAKEKGKTIILFAAKDERVMQMELMKLRGHRGKKIYIDHHLLDIITHRKISELEKMMDIIHSQLNPFGEESKP